MKIDLNKIQIATPCTAKWEQMKGNSRVRHCGECKLNVYNIAGMPKAEAEALIARSLKGERVCVRLTQRAGGTVLTQDCPEGLRLLRKARLKLASAMASIFALCFGLAAFSRSPASADEDPAAAPRRMGEVSVSVEPQAPPPPKNVHLMGKVAAPQPPPPPKDPRPQK
jgi:hypothetical protein